MTETLTHHAEPGARRDRRRRKTLRRRLVRGACVLIPVMVLVVVALTRPSGNDAKPVARPVGGTLEGEQVTYLLVGTKAGDTTGQANWLTLLAVDRSGGRPLSLFIPTSTLSELPGFGFDALGKALSLGRVSGQEVAVENLLGIQVDHTLLVSEGFLSKLVDRAGGLDVTIDKALFALDGTGRRVPIFQPGRQHLDGARTARYIAYVAPDESELARFVRAQAVWEALYARFGSKDANKLAQIVAGFGSSLLTDAAPADAGSLFAAFASAGPGARQYRPLPVEAVSSGGAEDAFRVKDAELTQLVAELLAGSRPADTPGRGARVRILNGNGQPEVGVRVAALILPAGFRIVATGNASSFMFPKTKIIVYRDADLAIAERIKSLLGLGEIEISRTAQTIVDVTIVVGHDFLAKYH